MDFLLKAVDKGPGPKIIMLSSLERSPAGTLKNFKIILLSHFEVIMVGPLNFNFDSLV